MNYYTSYTECQFSQKLIYDSEYHQVSMFEGDINKTTFRTHKGYYKLRVMSFGLTNVPDTFHGLMNSIFRQYFRKIVLVFFNDILVYSSNLQKHLLHLHILFATLKQTHYLPRSPNDHLGVKDHKQGILATSNWDKEF